MEASEPPWLILADDEPRVVACMRALAHELLGASGTLHVITATTVDDACRALDDAPEGRRLAVITDHDFRDPVRTGMDVLRHARQRRPRALRVLMSGIDLQDLTPGATPEDVQLFLPKPHRVEDVGRILDFLVTKPRTVEVESPIDERMSR